MSTSLCLAVLLLLLLAPVAAAAVDDDDAEQLLEQFKVAVRNRGELGGWNRGNGLCRFPGAVCIQGGRMLASLSLAGVPLDIDFRAITNTLLRLGGVEAVSLRGANVSGSLADGATGGAGGWRCGQRLAELDLSGNGTLRGSVLDTGALAGACGGLRELNLSGDALVGGGKGDGGAGFSGLDVLDLSYNMIGDLSWMARAGAGGVRRLDLAANKISGPLPTFANCSRMESLDLSGNLIFGAVLPDDLSGCTALVSLNLSSNHLNGAFPPDIVGLTSLSYLNLSGKHLKGAIPPGITGLIRLSSLSLSFNYFNGSLPDTPSALAELRTLDLSSNALTDAIPPGIAGLTWLSSLSLSFNYLNGSLPDTWGALTELSVGEEN